MNSSEICLHNTRRGSRIPDRKNLEPRPSSNLEKYIYINRIVGIYEYRVIQKEGLNFVRLYFLNFTWYVNDLHNI